MLSMKARHPNPTHDYSSYQLFIALVLRKIPEKILHKNNLTA